MQFIYLDHVATSIKEAVMLSFNAGIDILTILFYYVLFNIYMRLLMREKFQWIGLVM
jgi:hypothetical protein